MPSLLFIFPQFSLKVLVRRSLFGGGLVFLHFLQVSLPFIVCIVVFSLTRIDAQSINNQNQKSRGKANDRLHACALTTQFDNSELIFRARDVALCAAALVVPVTLYAPASHGSPVQNQPDMSSPLVGRPARQRSKARAKRK